jgi:ferredoxin
MVTKYIITSECIKCEICVEICPIAAIEEMDTQFVINDTCINCGKCIVVCPIDAIKKIP